MTETRTASIGLNESGMVVVRIRDDAYQTLDDAKENLSACVAETGGRRRPLLVDVRTSRPLDADARHHYSGQTLVDHFSALAMIIPAGPFGRMLGNVYLRIARPGIPTQLFAEEAAAVAWLDGHRA
jgi:hypothetical protein